MNDTDKAEVLWRLTNADRQGNPLLQRPADPDAVKRHLDAAEEPKWGLERRRRITRAVAALPPRGHERYDVIRFTRKTCGAVNLSHFYNEVATEETMAQLERMLGL